MGIVVSPLHKTDGLRLLLVLSTYYPILQSAASSISAGSISVYICGGGGQYKEEEGSIWKKRAVQGRRGQYMGGEEGRSVEPTTSPLAAP